MKFAPFSASLSALVFLGGCAHRTYVSPPPVEIHAPFREDEALAMLRPGSNSIKGNAFLRQQNGGIVTCAGADVALFPAVAYTQERMSAIYGTSAPRGFSHKVSPAFSPDPAAYWKAARIVKCDSSGRFEFENVGDGDYFVVTSVHWKVNQYTSTGGGLMERVAVGGGKSISIIMTD